MKLKKFIFTIVFIIGIFILWNGIVYAGDLELHNLDFDIKLNPDGSANVTETWDIAIENTNTLFKAFEIDNTKYSGIINVSLVETTNGINRNFSQIYVEKYHVDKNCFYALKNSSGEFEIAWGVHEDNSYARRTFKMSYTVIDAIKNYSDCSEFYWQCINNESEIPTKKITGTITLPTNVATYEDFRIWAHGPLNGSITKTSSNTAVFEVENFKANTMLEVRVTTPTYVFEANKNVSNTSKLDNILSEEQTWADQANRQRKIDQLMNIIFFIVYIIIYIAINIACIVFCVLLCKKAKKYKGILKELPIYKPTMESKYYRDIPNNNSTPAQAAFLYYFNKSNISSHVSDVISATMLDLCMKKYIEFQILSDKKKDIKIILKPNMDKDLLSADEKLIYGIFEKVKSGEDFTMQDFEKYCKSHPSTFLASCNTISSSATTELEKDGLYDKKLITEHNKWKSKGSGFATLAWFSIASLFVPLAWFFILCIIVLSIPAIICAVYCFKISKRYNTLTQKGVDEKEAWNGLKNYMEDFSMMDEKEVPELMLWEKYLVFATAFGIADKVQKQLKVVYPQIADAEYMNSHGYTYLYYMSHTNISNNFMNSIHSSVASAYTSAIRATASSSSGGFSSGSGSGGGFSSGGGFGGGGGHMGGR